MKRPGITPRRMDLFDRLERLYAIGGGPGANRIGDSPEEDEAHRMCAEWMREAGLDVAVDPYGNLIGRLVGRNPGLTEVWAGSHLDSVPQGGKYDGPLGVLAALEAVQRLGQRNPTLGVVVFRDEERGCRGSRDLVNSGQCPGVFLEVHHEQGERLTRAGVPVGVVSGIVGYVRGSKTIRGRAGHAGTTPMEDRDDALVAAAAEILRIRDAASSIEGAVATVGCISAEPGGINVIPGEVRFSVDARAPDIERLDELVAAIGIEAPHRIDPQAMHPDARAALGAATRGRGHELVELFSGAGHDAGVLAAAGAVAGMLFVRAGNGGVSHSPDEVASDEDVDTAVDILADALGSLA